MLFKIKERQLVAAEHRVKQGLEDLCNVEKLFDELHDIKLLADDIYGDLTPKQKEITKYIPLGQLNA
jgi:predicted DNA binding protein